METLNGIDVVILAGGLGTRLRPALPDQQKVLAKVAGRPFLELLIEFVRKNGAMRLILALGHRAEQVQSFLKSRRWEGLDLIPSVEPAPLGTGGALRFTLPHIHTDIALVLNGDSYAAADLRSFLKFHHTRNAVISMLVVPRERPGPYGLVECDENGSVVRFVEKPSKDKADGYINAGVYIFDRGTIAKIEDESPVSLEREVIPRYCKSGLCAMKQDVPFIDIGTPESWRAASSFFDSLQVRSGSSDH